MQNRTPSPTRREYIAPKLSIYGCVEEITATIGTAAAKADKTGLGGNNKTH